jgi:hypothetical protein
LAYSVTLTRLLLQAIQRLCESNGARFFIFLLEDPTLLPEEPTLFQVNGKGVVLSGASARHIVDEVLGGVPTVRMPAAPFSSFVSATDHHLNEEGNRYVMEALGDRLQAELQ